MTAFYLFVVATVLCILYSFLWEHIGTISGGPFIGCLGIFVLAVVGLCTTGATLFFGAKPRLEKPMEMAVMCIVMAATLIVLNLLNRWEVHRYRKKRREQKEN